MQVVKKKEELHIFFNRPRTPPMPRKPCNAILPQKKYKKSPSFISYHIQYLPPPIP